MKKDLLPTSGSERKFTNRRWGTAAQPSTPPKPLPFPLSLVPPTSNLLLLAHEHRLLQHSLKRVVVLKLHLRHGVVEVVGDGVQDRARDRADQQVERSAFFPEAC